MNQQDKTSQRNAARLFNPQRGTLRTGVDVRALILAGLLLAAVAAPIWPVAPASQSPGASAQSVPVPAPDDGVPWPGSARRVWDMAAGVPAPLSRPSASTAVEQPVAKKASPPAAKPAAPPKPAVAAPVAAPPKPAAPAPATPAAAPVAPVAEPKAAAPAPPKPAPKVVAPVVAPPPAPAPASPPAPAPAPTVRTIYIAGAGGQALVDSCIGPIHFTPTDGYSLFITEHDFCGGWARFSGIQVGERVDLPGYGSYTVGARGQVPNGGTTNDVAAVFGGFPRAVLQTCIPGTTQMLVIALN